MAREKTTIRFEDVCGSGEAISPAAQLGLAIVAVLSFKMFLALQSGLAAYQAAMADLAGGGIVERALAKALTLDAVSQAVAAALVPYLP